MAIAHVSTATSTGDGVTTLSPTIPSGSAGDAIVIAVHTRRTAGLVTITESGGAYDPVSGGTTSRGSIRIATFTRIATGSDAGTFNFSAACGAVAVVTRYSGVDNTTPVDVAASVTNGNGSTVTLGSVTTATNNAWVVGCVGWNGAGATLAPQGSMTERGDADGAFASNDLECNLSDELIATAGATGTRSVTGGFADDYVGVMFALRPGAPATHPVEQEGYRWRADDGSESTATWLAAQDANLTRDVSQSTRLRVLLNATGDPDAATYQLEYRLSGGSYAAVLAAQPSAPTFQAAGTAVGGAGAVSPTWPTHQAGDIGLLLIESAGGEAATLSTAAGFVAVADSPQNTGATTTGTRITAFWARASSSSMATPTVADPGNHAYAVILTFRGCIESGDPWDVTAGAVKASASTSASAPGDTTTVDNCLVVAIIARENDSAAAAFSSWANGDLTSVTEQFDAGTVSGNGGGLGVATGVLATAGAFGTTTATVTSSINASLTIALRPPALYPILLATSANIAASAATATTAQLTAPSGKSTSDFVAGAISDDTNPLPSLNITTDDYMELEWCLTAQSGAAATSDVYEFRVTAAGILFDDYTLTPQWTIGSAASHDITASATADPATGAASLASTIPNFAATASATAPAATGAAALAVTQPGYAITAAATADAATGTALGSVTQPTYGMTAAASADLATGAASLASTIPTYSSTASATAPAATASASLSVTQPGYAITASGTADPATGSALGSVTPPNAAITAAAIADQATGAATLASTIPTYSSVASATADPATGAASLSATQPGYAITASATADPASGSATLASTGVSYGITASATADPASGAASLASTTPAYAATVGATADPATGAASLSVTQPAYAITASATADSATAAALGASSAPGTVTATASATADPATGSASLASTTPTYAATASATADPATASARLASGIPAYDVTGAAMADIPTASASMAVSQPAYTVVVTAIADPASASATLASAAVFAMVVAAQAPPATAQALLVHTVGGIGSLTLSVARVGDLTTNVVAVGDLTTGVAAVGGLTLTIEPE